MWYVRASQEGTEHLALMPDGRRFAVISSPTGNYLAGHAETFADKQSELANQGFLPIDVARDRGVIRATWVPPRLTHEDYDFLELRGIPLPPEHRDVDYSKSSRIGVRTRTVLRRLFGRSRVT